MPPIDAPLGHLFLAESAIWQVHFLGLGLQHGLMID
jgi:hypothetical protein